MTGRYPMITEDVSRGHRGPGNGITRLLPPRFAVRSLGPSGAAAVGNVVRAVSSGKRPRARVIGPSRSRRPV